MIHNVTKLNVTLATDVLLCTILATPVSALAVNTEQLDANNVSVIQHPENVIKESKIELQSSSNNNTTTPSTKDKSVNSNTVSSTPNKVVQPKAITSKSITQAVEPTSYDDLANINRGTIDLLVQINTRNFNSCNSITFRLTENKLLIYINRIH